MAVNIANGLPRDRFRPYLCSTRRAGPLACYLNSDVGHLNLERRSRFDFGCVSRLRTFIRQENINLLHAHSSSLFLGRLVSLLVPSRRISVIWHDHYGRSEWRDRPASLYRLATKGAAGVIAVNYRLVEWARKDLGISPERIWYVPNFVPPTSPTGCASKELPGSPGSRIVCVANLRPQKDHLNLIRAMAVVLQSHPNAHLLVIGAPVDAAYADSLRHEVSRLHVEKNVTFFGQVTEVAAVLLACDIGVLSSASEGLPLSLLEYGRSGLPVVATSVGQCPEVLNYGRVGILVEPSAPEQLAEAIRRLLESTELRQQLGRQLREFVRKVFAPEGVLNRICRIYDFVLSESAS